MGIIKNINKLKELKYKYQRLLTSSDYPKRVQYLIDSIDNEINRLNANKERQKGLGAFK